MVPALLSASEHCLSCIVHEVLWCCKGMPKARCTEFAGRLSKRCLPIYRRSVELF